MYALTDTLLRILEKPWAKKHYSDLKKHLLSTGRVEEAAAIQHLIDTKYDHRPDTNEE